MKYFLLSFRKNDNRLKMGPTRRRKSKSQYDPDLYENWIIVQLIKRGVKEQGNSFSY